MSKKVYQTSRRAFTLIELLVVIAIIGILAVIVTANYIGAQARARDAKRVSGLESVQTALAMYYADNKTYPLSKADGSHGSVSECSAWGGVTGEVANVISKLVPGYLPSWPKDPLNQSLNTNSYCYLYKSNGTDYAFLLYDASGSEINWIAQSDLIDPVKDGDTDCTTTNTIDNSVIQAWKVYTTGGRCW